MTRANGIAIGMLGIGGVFLWSGIKGVSVTAVIQDVITGKTPLSAAAANTFNIGPLLQPGGITSSVNSAASSAAGSVTTGAVSSPTALQQYAFSLFPSFGWGTNQEAPLVALWTQESGWNPNAQNPTSTAYGIAQFLDSTWAPYGAKTSDPQLQIKYGLEYIRDRYVNPAGAEAHEKANNWY